MPFKNPIVAGLELIRNAIRSPNYEASTSGWSINKDGTAEFLDVLIRGDFLAGILAGAHVAIDGDTGVITIEGTTGDVIEIDPTEINPVIKFYSNDGTNFAFINQPATSNVHASLGLNSGQYLPADTIARTIRTWLDSQTDTGRYEVINANTQLKAGGYCDVRSTDGQFGYQNVANGIHHWIIARPADGITLYSDVPLGGCVAQYRRDLVATIVNGSAIPWTVEDFDNMGLHNAVNPTRITVTRAGRYRVSGIARHQPIASGTALSTSHMVNGVGVTGAGVTMSANGSPSAGNGIPIGPFVHQCAAGDFIEVTVGNNVATAVNCNGSTVNVEYLGV